MYSNALSPRRVHSSSGPGGHRQRTLCQALDPLCDLTTRNLKPLHLRLLTETTKNGSTSGRSAGSSGAAWRRELVDFRRKTVRRATLPDFRRKSIRRDRTARLCWRKASGSKSARVKFGTQGQGQERGRVSTAGCRSQRKSRMRGPGTRRSCRSTAERTSSGNLQQPRAPWQGTGVSSLMVAETTLQNGPRACGVNLQLGTCRMPVHAAVQANSARRASTFTTRSTQQTPKT